MKWKEVEGIFFRLSFHVAFFCVLGIAGITCLGLLAEISYPKFLENDIGWPR